jgi:phosphoglycolate phosphatase
MRPKLIIFDFDGTLADTKKSIFKTMTITLNHFGKKCGDESSLLKIKNLIGTPLTRIFKEFGLKDDQFEEATLFYRSIYNEIAGKTVELYPFVKDTLDHLSKEGVKLAVASNKGKDALEYILTAQGIMSYFEIVAGEQDVDKGRKKPAPDMANLVMSKTGIAPKDTLIVGDTSIDTYMARNAFCQSCIVNYGYGSEESIKESAPSYSIDCFSELKRE